MQSTRETNEGNIEILNSKVEEMEQSEKKMKLEAEPMEQQ